MLCQCGFLLVQNPPLLAIRVFYDIIHTGIPQVQGILQNLIGVDSGGAVGGVRIHIPIADILLPGNAPLRCIGRVIHDNGTPEIERRLKQIFHERLNILFVNPGCTQAHINFGSIQIFGLRLFQSLHIVPKHLRFLRGTASNGQLLPHITGEVFIRRHIAGRAILIQNARKLEDYAAKLIRKIFNGFPGQLGHVRHIDAGVLRNGNGECFRGSIHRGNGSGLTNGAFGEHIRFPQKFVIFVQDFQTAQQIVGAVIRERQSVSFGIDQSVLCGEGIIQLIQLCLFCGDFLVGCQCIHLEGNQIPDTIPQTDHSANPVLGSCFDLGLDHNAVFTIVDFSIYQRIGEVFDAGIGWNGLADFLSFTKVWQFRFLIAAVDVLDGIVQQRSKGDLFVGDYGVVQAESGALRGFSTQNHVRIVEEVSIDGKAVIVFPKGNPLRFIDNGPVPLLEEQDIGDHFCTSVGFEGIVGKPDSAQQLSPLCNILSDSAVLGIHCVAAGDESHDTARTQLIQALCKKVVVDRKAQLIESRVIHTILPKGDIADCQVIEIFFTGLLKAGDGDVCIGIQLLGDPTGETVQLNTIEAAVLHPLGQHSEEVAHAHRRLQNVAGLETHVFNSLIHSADDGRAGVMGIQRGSSCRLVFLIGEFLFQLCVFKRPFRLGVIKSIGKTAPTNILPQHFLLVVVSLSAALFQFVEQTDCRIVPCEFLLRAANTKVVIGNVVVDSRGCWLGRKFWFDRFARCFQCLDDHIEGQMVFLCRDGFYGLDGIRRVTVQPVLQIGTDKISRLYAEDGKAGASAERIVLQGDFSGMVVNRINDELPVINFQLLSYGKILAALVLMETIVGTILVCTHQHKAVAVAPDFLSLCHPAFCREPSHRNGVPTFNWPGEDVGA